MPSALKAYLPAQYAAGIVTKTFASIAELCMGLDITAEEFNARRELAQERGDDLITMGRGHDYDGPLGEVRIVAMVMANGAIRLGLAPEAAIADTYYDASMQLFLLKVEKPELILADDMVGVVRSERGVTLQ